MIFANAMTAISLAGERFDDELSRGVDADKALPVAFRAALIPQVNAFFAVGLVSLPGMMTGQIIAGIEPLLAIRYQIVVMAMIFGSAGLSVALFRCFLSEIPQIKLHNFCKVIPYPKWRQQLLFRAGV